MALALHLRLRDEPEAAALARRAIAAILAPTSLVDADLVSLVVTELIGRFSNPAGEDDLALDVHVDVNASRIRVHVTGPARGAAQAPEPAPGSTLSAGWSLLLIERTVDRWGIDDGPATRVWFEIDLADVGERQTTAPGAGSRH
jgi:hypothetical protein